MELKNPDNLYIYKQVQSVPEDARRHIRLLVGQDAHGDRPDVAHRTADASLRTVGRGVVHGSRQSGAGEPSWC